MGIRCNNCGADITCVICGGCGREFFGAGKICPACRGSGRAQGHRCPPGPRPTWY